MGGKRQNAALFWIICAGINPRDQFFKLCFYLLIMSHPCICIRIIEFGTVENYEQRNHQTELAEYQRAYQG